MADREAGEHKDDPSWTSFRTEMPARGKKKKPFGCIAPCFRHAERQSCTVKYPRCKTRWCRSKWIQYTSTPDSTWRTDINMHMFSVHLTSQGELLFFFSPLRIQPCRDDGVGTGLLTDTLQKLQQCFCDSVSAE